MNCGDRDRDDGMAAATMELGVGGKFTDKKFSRRSRSEWNPGEVAS